MRFAYNPDCYDARDPQCPPEDEDFDEEELWETEVDRWIDEEIERRAEL